jgi:2-polyprenyl-3-methyl-5-hydroxy-6-metoxy-1,4-benzoquinol methylase
MIARKRLPAEFEAWNDIWGSPFGYRGNRLYGEGEMLQRAVAEAMLNPADPDFGPFAFQMNSDTRVYEYPWAFSTAKPESGMLVLDVGGGVSGLQYVLAKSGCEVTNFDPGARPDYESSYDANFGMNPELHASLNTIFGTAVRLVAEKIQDADLEPGSLDRAFCLSVLEHVDREEAQQMIESMARLLRPGGLALLTVDLFLDLKPFGVLDRNVWGINQDLGALVKGSGLTLAEGDPRELLGFPEFDFNRVVRLLPELRIGRYYPVMTQTLVLEKPQ